VQRRFHPMFYVVLPLAVLGFATQFESLLRNFAIPIALVAVLFVVYYVMKKRPAGHRKTRVYRSAPPRKSARRPSEKPRAQRQTIPFRVIEGKKERRDDEQDTPRYH